MCVLLSVCAQNVTAQISSSRQHLSNDDYLEHYKGILSELICVVFLIVHNDIRTNEQFLQFTAGLGLS